VNGVKKRTALYVQVGFGSRTKLGDVTKADNGIARSFPAGYTGNGSTDNRYEFTLVDARGRTLASDLRENVSISCTPDIELLSATAVGPSRWSAIYCDITLSYRVNDTFDPDAYDLFNRINDSATRGSMDLTPGTYTDVYMVARDNDGGVYSVWLELTSQDSIFTVLGSSNTISGIVSSCPTS
jgi:hypothetical protein